MTLELLIATLAVGMLAGALTALLGVAGGIVMIPFLVLVASETQHTAEGTVLLAVLPTALLGTVVHRRRGNVRLRRAALLGAGGVVGAVGGATLGLSLPEETLRSIFAVVLFVLAAYMVLRTPASETRSSSGTNPASADTTRGGS